MESQSPHPVGHTTIKTLNQTYGEKIRCIKPSRTVDSKKQLTCTSKFRQKRQNWTPSVSHQRQLQFRSETVHTHSTHNTIWGSCCFSTEMRKVGSSTDCKVARHIGRTHPARSHLRNVHCDDNIFVPKNPAKHPKLITHHIHGDA